MTNLKSLHDRLTAALSRRVVRTVALGVLLILVLFEGLLHFRYTSDDSFIYFQYARNLAERGEVSFNPGEPSNGITGPVWMILSSVTYVLFGDVLTGTKTLDLIIAMASIAVFYAVARDFLTDNVMTLLATSCFATNVWFVRWAGTGMETSAAVCVTLMLLWSVFRRRSGPAFALLSVLVLIRPEAVLFGPPVFAYLFARDPARRVSPLLGWAAVGSLPVLAWALYAWTTFGQPLPNTRGKAAWSLTFTEFGATLYDIGKTLLVSDAVLLAVLLIPLSYLATNLWAFGSRSRRTAITNGNELLLLTGLFLALIAFYTISGTNVVSRYLLLATPVIPLVVFKLLSWLAERVPARRQMVIAVSLTAATVSVAQNQIFYWSVVEPGIMRFQDGMDNVLIPIGRWLNEHTPEGSRVLIGDIGAVGFYSHRPLDDAAGLISPEAREILRTGVQPYDMIASGSYRSWADPDYVVHRAVRPNALLPDSMLEAEMSREFRQLTLEAQVPIFYTVYRRIR